MTVTIERFKKAMNLDEVEDNDLVQGYLTAAEHSIKTAVGEDKSGEFYARKIVASMMDVAVIAIAGSYYTYRLSVADAQTYPVNLTSNAVIGQLRGLYDVFMEGQDG